tara:strand:- start:191 stop:445 length:255 start_codon:yes stop_codon:yes gene_type:complete
MVIILVIIISLIIGFIIGRRTRYKIKNYGVTRKMFLTLEKQEIDRKIQLDCDLEDYEEALYYKRKMEKVERKLERVKRKEQNNN